MPGMILGLRGIGAFRVEAKLKAAVESTRKKAKEETLARVYFELKAERKKERW